MAKRLPHITAAELRILKVLWRLGREVTVRDIRDELEQEGPDNPAYTTVMTLMNQLAAKKALHVDKDRQPYMYRAALRREQVLRDRIEQFLSSVFDGQAGELVLHLVEAADLSPDDLKRIEEKVEAREREEQGRAQEGER